MLYHNISTILIWFCHILSSFDGYKHFVRWRIMFKTCVRIALECLILLTEYHRSGKVQGTKSTIPAKSPLMTHKENLHKERKEVTKANIFLAKTSANTFLRPLNRVRRSTEAARLISECTVRCSWEEVGEVYGSKSHVNEFAREFRCGSDCQGDAFTYCELTTTSWKEIHEVQYRCARDGGWGIWGTWGACSVSCGSGEKKRNRKCDSPAQLGGGSYCTGSNTETVPCTLSPCPVDGVWGTWEQWGACSVTCATGNKLRNRTCDNPEPSNGGLDCTGNNQSSISCTLDACPVHGGWASWTGWSSCAVVNNMVSRTRCRTCTNPAPDNGGDRCPDRRLDSEHCKILRSALRRPCRCPASRVIMPKNFNAEELAELVKIKKELSVDVSTLSRFIRKKISVKDKRSSSQYIGVLGAVMSTFALLIVVGLDLVNVWQFFQNKVTKVKVRSKLSTTRL